MKMACRSRFLEVFEEFGWACLTCSESSDAYNPATGTCDLCTREDPRYNYSTGSCAEFSIPDPEPLRCNIAVSSYNPLTERCDLCTPLSLNYDPDSGNCQDVVAFDLLEISYSRDNLGRITRQIVRNAGAFDYWRYRYDSLGRLIYQQEGFSAAGRFDYQYDDNGNRTHVNSVEVGIYDEQDRLISYDGESYSYSANGDLETKGTTSYEYDVFSNLRKVTTDSKSIEYIVDPQHRRIGKKVDGTLVQGFIYQDQLNPIAELDGAGNVVKRFVYGEKRNVPDYFLQSGKRYRIISDHLGSPRLVIDMDDMAVVQRLSYDAWGVVLEDTNPGFQPFGFAGGIYDVDTGLVRFGARDYDAAVGRWTTKDPIDFGGGQLNLYGYAHSDPVNYVDVTGESPAALVGGLLGAWTSYQNGGNFKQVALSAAAGAIYAGINPASLITKFATSAIGNASDQFINGGFNNDCVNLGDAALAGVLGSFLPSFIQPKFADNIGEGAITELLTAGASSSVESIGRGLIGGFAQ